MSEYEAMPMHRKPMRVQVEQIENAVLELRYFDTPGSNYYRGWKLSVVEAADLTAWWTSQGRLINSWHLPIRCLRTGRILISMFTLANIEVCGLDWRDKPKMQSCFLPREVVKVLARWHAETHTVTKPLFLKEAETCSRES